MKVVCFVPLRKQSKRVLDKNNQLIGGKSLVSHITYSVAACRGIDSFYLYTSSDDYLADAHPCFKLLVRDPLYDSDHTLGIDIIQSFSSLVHADIYILVHATSPFLTPSSLQIGLDSVRVEGYDSSYSACKIQTFTWYDGSPLNYDPGFIPRTQDIKPIYYETSAFYIYRREVIDSGRRIGVNPKMIELSGIESVDIDDPDDLDLARSYWNSKFN